jgi:hypothetical protein
MKFSLIRITLFALCGVAAVSLAMPAHYNLDVDVEVRAVPLTDSELLEARRGGGGGGGGLGDVVEMIINVVGAIKAGIAQDKKVIDVCCQFLSSSDKSSYAC